MMRWEQPAVFHRIVRTAKRYMRLYGGIKTVADWNNLCERIGTRGGYYPVSIRAAQIDYLYLSRSPIILYYPEDGTPVDEHERPRCRWFRWEIEDRLKKMRAAREARKLREQDQRQKAWDEIYQAKYDISQVNAALRRAKAKFKELQK